MACRSKRYLNKWHVVEAQYLVKLANDHVQFTYNMPSLLPCYNAPIKDLASPKDPVFARTSQSVGGRFVYPTNYSASEYHGLYLRLTALNNLIDQLVLPVNPLKPESQSNPPQKSKTQLPWWQEGVNRPWQALRQFVVIRKIYRLIPLH